MSSGGAEGSLARQAIEPVRAGLFPSQCCSKSTANDFNAPEPSNVASLTVNFPVSSLQPRPLPLTSSPAPVELNGYRVAPVKVVPGRRRCPEDASKSANHQSSPEETEKDA